ncbi:MAG: hypothetical protein ABI823_06045 [Bryobacteraceae bacterium]
MINALLERLEGWKALIYPEVNQVAPRLVGALVLLVLAWIVATGVRWAVRRTEGIGPVERLLVRSGILSGLVERSLAEPRRATANALFVCILAAGGVAALAVISEPVATVLGTMMVTVLPSVLLVFAIISVAWWAGRRWSQSALIWMTNEGVACPWRWATFIRIAILMGGIALASECTGFARPLIRDSFLILLAGGTFAAAQALVPPLKAHFVELFSSPARQKEPQREDLFR